MGKTAGPVGYRRRILCPVSENQAYCGPFPGSIGSYKYYVGADRSIYYEHDIIFSGDKFVKLPYGKVENVKVLDVNDPHEGTFLQSIRQEKWPKGFRKEEGVHTISITGLHSGQDLLKDIGLCPSSPVSEDDSDSDDDLNYGSDDDMDQSI
ncbi:hypothetical protein ACHQM5_005219 [Ranunculus cassubicifolius]